MRPTHVDEAPSEMPYAPASFRLRDWLESLREELADLTGTEVPRPRPEPGDPTPSETVAEKEEAVARLGAALTDGVPAEHIRAFPDLTFLR